MEASMRRPLILLSAFLLVTGTAFARGNHHGRNVSFNDWDDTATDCSAMRVTFGGERAPVVTENVPVGNARSLRVRSDQNGGIRVFGTTGSAYAVTACKAAAAGSDLSQVRVTLNGDEVSASGPDNENWVVFFIVQSPVNATLDVRATNGPIGIRDFDGKLTARAQNGPVGLKNSRGTIDASTVNGPIAIEGGSGSVKLSATNGPLAVKLDGSTWNGNLDASTQNGPVSLKLPRGYRSGVVVEQLGHGPVSCHAEDCYSARQRAADLNNDDGDDDNDRPRRFELGSGAAAVHLSTVNGPVSVRDRD
jgi:hypothetical protein